MQFQKATKTEAKERDSDLVRELKLLMDTIPSIVGKARVSDRAKKHAALPMSLLQSLAFPSALKGRQIDRTHTGTHTHTHIHMRSNRRRERQNENVQEVGDRGLLLRDCDSETSLDLLPPHAGFHVGRPPRNPHTRPLYSGVCKSLFHGQMIIINLFPGGGAGDILL
jgi:hypothetical protein